MSKQIGLTYEYEPIQIVPRDDVYAVYRSDGKEFTSKIHGMALCKCWQVTHYQEREDIRVQIKNDICGIQIGECGFEICEETSNLIRYQSEPISDEETA